MADEDGAQAADEPSQVKRTLSPWLRHIQRSVASLSDAEREELAGHLREFAQLGEVAPAINTWVIGPEAQLRSWPFEAFGADQIILLGDENQAIPESLVIADSDIVKPENVSRLASKAAQVGINRLSPAQILILVLTWLLLVGLPLIQAQLSPEAQAVTANEYATIGIAIAITTVIMQKGK